MAVPRLLIIGLDGADLGVVEPFVAQGRLPNLARLLAQGARGTLRSTCPPMSPAAWTTFMTGKNPGKHGVFDFTARKPNSYEVEFVNARFRRVATLWRIMSEAGKRVCVLSVPITFPPEKLNGIQVSGLDTPGVSGGLAEANAMHPPELHAELMERFGGYLISANLKGAEGLTVQEIVEAVGRTIDRKMSTAQYLYAKEPWDCFMITIGETDGISHRLWHYHDKQCPMGDENSRAYQGDDPLALVYERIDGHIGRLLALAPPDTMVFVLSDHGHAGNSDKAVYLNRWLAEQGWLSFDRRRGPRLLSYLLGLAKKLGTRNVIPLKYRKRLFRRTALAGKVESYLRFARLDWSRTRAYSEETPYYPSVWINVAGREPNGVVPPGEAYERERAAVIRGLEEWTDPISGQRLVKRAYRREELYSGEQVGVAPDIVIDWNLDGDYSYLFRTSKAGDLKPAVARLEGPERTKAKSGDHRDDGLLIAVGPHIKPVRSEGARLLDMAPTLLHCLGLPVPDDLDGNVLTQLFDDEHLRSNPVRQTPPARPEEPPDTDAGRYSEDEKDEVRRRLQGLGYLE
jgi:predicted AlkP superfamily phosphohydrolase/phosphomutase